MTVTKIMLIDDAADPTSNVKVVDGRKFSFLFMNR